MQFVNAQGFTTLIFLIASVSALIIGIIFSHQLNRYGTSTGVSGVAEMLFTAGTIFFLAVSAYALFFFYF